MGGSSKGPTMRPEVQVDLAPSPQVSPVKQPNPAQTNYSQYYMPASVEALRQSVMTQNRPMPFGVRSPYTQVPPNSNYAAPRPPQIFAPSNIPTPNPMQSIYEQRLRELEARLGASDGRSEPVGYGGGGGNG